MGFTNIFSIDEKGNPVVIEAKTESEGTKAIFSDDLRSLSKEQWAEYWHKVQAAFTERLYKELEGY